MLWPARVLWFLLPLSVGPVLRDALASWSTSPALAAAIMLYAAWVAGLVALVVPRPPSFTVLRVLAPSAVVVTAFGIHAAPLWLALLALAHAIAACACSLHGSVAQACTQSAAYGDEVRRPLRTPPLLCLVLALTVPVVGAGIAAGPLLLADGRVAAGIVCTVLGLGLAAMFMRSFHSLSRRFVVFVPAGFVLSDPLVLPDPVLLPRERIAALSIAPPRARVDGLDARLGAFAGAIVVTLDEPGSFTLRQGRAAVAVKEASAVWCTPQRPSSVLATAATRRLGAATAPPRPDHQS